MLLPYIYIKNERIYCIFYYFKARSKHNLLSADCSTSLTLLFGISPASTFTVICGPHKCYSVILEIRSSMHFCFFIMLWFRDKKKPDFLSFKTMVLRDNPHVTTNTTHGTSENTQYLCPS